MRRMRVSARPEWVALLQATGFEDCVRDDGSRYWIEDACYELNAAQAQELVVAAETCERAVRALLPELLGDAARLARLGLSPALAAQARDSWTRGDPSLLGRMDFAFDGARPPQLLEYNADTPTALFEAAIAQRDWLCDRDPAGRQVNRLHDALIAAFSALAPAFAADSVLHVVSVHADFDSAGTAQYVAECAAEAGIDTVALDINDVGLLGDRVVDLEGRPLAQVFKLYPWEWLAAEDPRYFAALARHQVRVLEPAWRAAVASKGILVELWNADPASPHLLPAAFAEEEIAGERIGKPLQGRQGLNLKLRFEEAEADMPGPYGAMPCVWQARARSFDGLTPVFGVWIIAGRVAGIGIREDSGAASGPRANFVPHRLV